MSPPRRISTSERPGRARFWNAHAMVVDIHCLCLHPSSNHSPRSRKLHTAVVQQSRALHLTLWEVLLPCVIDLRNSDLWTRRRSEWLWQLESQLTTFEFAASWPGRELLVRVCGMAEARYFSCSLVAPSPRQNDASTAVALAVSTLREAARHSVAGVEESCQHALELLHRRVPIPGGRLWAPFEQVLIAGETQLSYDPGISATVKEALECLSGLIRGGGFHLLVGSDIGAARGLIMRACRAFEPEEEPATGDALVELVAAANDCWVESVTAEAIPSIMRMLVLVGARSSEPTTTSRSWELAVATIKRCHAHRPHEMPFAVQALCEIAALPIPAAALHGSVSVQRAALALQLLRHIFTGPPGASQAPFDSLSRKPSPVLCTALGVAVVTHCTPAVPAVQEITLALVEAVCINCAAVRELSSTLASVLLVSYPRLLNHSMVSSKSKIHILDALARIFRQPQVALALYRSFGDQLFSSLFGAAVEASQLSSAAAIVAHSTVESALRSYYSLYREEMEEDEEWLDRDEYLRLLASAEGPMGGTRSPLTPIPDTMLASATGDRWLCLPPKITPYEPTHLASFSDDVPAGALSHRSMHSFEQFREGSGSESQLVHLHQQHSYDSEGLSAPLASLLPQSLSTLLPHAVEVLRSVAAAAGAPQVLLCCKSFYNLINCAAAARSEAAMFMINQAMQQSEFDFPNESVRALYVWLLEHATLHRPKPPPPPAPLPMRASPSNIQTERGFYGYFGVTAVSGTAGFTASITQGGMLKVLGSFDTSVEAATVVATWYYDSFGILPPERTSRGYYGVSISGQNSFRADLAVSGKRQHLGSFSTADEAATVVSLKHLEVFGEAADDREPSTSAIDMPNSSKALYLALRTCTPLQVARAGSAGSVVWLHASYARQKSRLEAEGRHLPEEIASLEARIRHTEFHSSFGSAVSVVNGMEGLKQLQVQDLHTLLASTSKTVLSLLANLIRTIPNFTPDVLPSGRGARAALATPLLVALRNYQLPAVVKSPSGTPRVKSPRGSATPIQSPMPSPRSTPRTGRARSLRWSAKDSIAKMNGRSARSSPAVTPSGTPRGRSNSPTKQLSPPKSGGLVRSILKAEAGVAGQGRKGLFRETLKQQMRESNGLAAASPSPRQSPRATAFEPNSSPRSGSTSPRSPRVDTEEPSLELSLEEIAEALQSGTQSPRSKTPVSSSTKQVAGIVLSWVRAVQEYKCVAPNVAGYWQLLAAVRELSTLKTRIEWCKARKVVVAKVLPKIDRRFQSCGIVM